MLYRFFEIGMHNRIHISDDLIKNKMVTQKDWNKTEISNMTTPVNSSVEDSDGSGSSSSASDLEAYNTTSEMAHNVYNQLSRRFYNTEPVPNKREAVMRALELLRMNVQGAFDQEIDVIVQKFTGLYFKTALKNMKENLGDHGVSDDVLLKMSCALLENSKEQYKLENEEETGANIQYMDTSETVPIQPNVIIKTEELSPNTDSNSETTDIEPPKRQIFWSTAHINTETRFILDIQANQAFGFTNEGKERVATKHPELVRYLPDGDDRDWLVDHKIIPSQHKNFRFLFLLYDDVMKLAHTENYFEKSNLNLSVLHYFRLPNFLIDKMHRFFIDLNIRSKGLITSTSTERTSDDNEMDRNSHLRNALLQGTSLQMQGVPKEPINQLPQQRHTFTSEATATSTTIDQQLNGTMLEVKPRPSLSASHATLTALLRSSSHSKPDNQ